MSMTDGHIFFDSNIFAKGRRPAINHALSVTRVGRQTQNQVRHDIQRELTTFLSLYERSESFSHFSAGLSESVRFTLKTGQKIYGFFDQPGTTLIPDAAQVFLFALLWRGFWQDSDINLMKKQLLAAVDLYEKDKAVKDYVDKAISAAENFNALLRQVDNDREKVRSLLNFDAK
jgi:F-type H+-transporting ATPase subunit alpha